MVNVIQTENAMWLQKGRPIYKVLRHTPLKFVSACQGQQDCCFFSFGEYKNLLTLLYFWSSAPYFRYDDQKNSNITVIVQKIKSQQKETLGL